MNYPAAKAFICYLLKTALDGRFSYHGLHHTLDVLQATTDLCHAEQVAPYETLLLQTAALFHDAGFIRDPMDHEGSSCELVREHLPRYDYTPREIEQICDLILATKIPQQPKSHLEQIICDADLDYLGREDFFAIAETLYIELHCFQRISNEKQWDLIQVQFLSEHQYFTETNRRRREKGREKHLEVLKKKLQ